MSAQTATTTVRTPDGLRLSGTLVLPDGARQAVVLVHGGGVTREEGGFFARLAAGLAEADIASLRFDLRGHGESEGRQEDLTLAGILADIRAAVALVCSRVGTNRVALLGASFSGGICGYYATQHPTELTNLIMFNPLLDYRKRLIDDKPYWHNGQISEEAGRELLQQGYLVHSPTFKLGRPLLNEVFYLQPHTVLGDIQAPTLIVHGTKDTFIPVESSRWAAQQLAVEHRLIEIDGAQHGFAVHDDPSYANPQSQQWQAEVIRSVADWISRH
ncbi:MAG TPA: alpha/beta fold hydrolase [Steroidobacteraceae bacterium]|nr:alpha/beta fold hydrolase [Steroidobacteraceae bacterium]